MSSHLAHAQSLCRFIDNSPSPFHAVASIVDVLIQAGFAEVGADAVGAGRHFRIRDGSIVAWVTPDGAEPGLPFQIVGAHTDLSLIHI